MERVFKIISSWFYLKNDTTCQQRNPPAQPNKKRTKVENITPSFDIRHLNDFKRVIKEQNHVLNSVFVCVIWNAWNGAQCIWRLMLTQTCHRLWNVSIIYKVFFLEICNFTKDEERHRAKPSAKYLNSNHHTTHWNNRCRKDGIFWHYDYLFNEFWSLMFSFDLLNGWFLVEVLSFSKFFMAQTS